MIKEEDDDVFDYKQLLMETQDEHRDYIPVYTDGSWDGNSLAYATFSNLSGMKDRSDEPSHHERMLYDRATSYSYTPPLLTKTAEYRIIVWAFPWVALMTEGRKEMLYLPTHSTHFMASDIR